MKIRINKACYPGTIKDRHWSKVYRSGFIYILGYIIVVKFKTKLLGK